MGVTNGVPNTPINSDDVVSATSYNNHDWAHFCTASNTRVNKWSKRKPVRGESPQDYATWDKNTGNVRSAVGFPIVWGMMVPFNNTQQLSYSGTTVASSALLKPLALRAAGIKSASESINVKNYVYCPPVADVDCSRIDDFIGYNQKAPEAWTCGVSGAEAGNPTGTLEIDTFDTAEIGFYIGCPHNADISFKDLFDTQGYRFIVELYKNDQSFPYDNTAPIARLVATKAIADMDTGCNFSILATRVRTMFGFTGEGEHTLYAVLGVVRFSSNPTLTEEKRTDNTGMGCAVLTASDFGKIVNGEGSIPPWNASSKPFVCMIKLQSYSKIELQVLNYAKLIPTSDTYKALPTSATTPYGSDGFRLQVTVRNKGTSKITLNGAYSGRGAYPPKIQIQATGAFDTSAASYSSMCLSPVESKWRDVEICSNAACTTNGQIPVEAGASATAYFKCSELMPIGRTSGFTFRVSTDNGSTWVITGRFSGAFLVS